jgi:hypothetical protein
VDETRAAVEQSRLAVEPKSQTQLVYRSHSVARRSTRGESP